MTLEPERLHVFRCYDRLPPLPGGMERHIAELTAAQRRMGVRVTELFNAGVPAGESVQLWRGWRLDKVRPSYLRFALFYAAAAARRMPSSDGRARVLHVHGDWPAFQLGRILGRRLKVATVAASLHATTHAPIGRYAAALRGCDPVFTTGFKQSQQLSEALRRPVIHLPSAPAELFFSKPTVAAEATDVLTVGSLVRVKNLEALLYCAARRPHLKFAILGEGPEREGLERLQRQLGLNNVQFRGAVALEEVHSAMHSARLFINTSFTEGSPTAALEAMACGLPVVLTPSNDYSAIVQQGTNGRVTSGWDVDELVQAIDEFMTDPVRQASAGDEARRVADRHRWDVKARVVTDAMIAAAERQRVMEP